MGSPCGPGCISLWGAGPVGMTVSVSMATPAGSPHSSETAIWEYRSGELRASQSHPYFTHRVTTCQLLPLSLSMYVCVGSNVYTDVCDSHTWHNCVYIHHSKYHYSTGRHESHCLAAEEPILRDFQ